MNQERCVLTLSFSCSVHFLMAQQAHFQVHTHGHLCGAGPLGIWATAANVGAPAEL